MEKNEFKIWLLKFFFSLIVVLFLTNWFFDRHFDRFDHFEKTKGQVIAETGLDTVISPSPRPRGLSFRKPKIVTGSELVYYQYFVNKKSFVGFQELGIPRSYFFKNEVDVWVNSEKPEFSYLMHPRRVASGWRLLLNFVVAVVFVLGVYCLKL